MNYIVMDMEYNSNFDFAKGEKAPANPRLPAEIIQIGAIKLDSELNAMGEFGTTVCPFVYKGLNPFVAKITGLSGNVLRNSPSFKAAYNGFLRFAAKEPAIMCFWGKDDIKELFRNILFHELDHRPISCSYINVQRLAAIYLGQEKSRMPSLATAAEALGIPLARPFHDAANDAYYTAEVFKIICKGQKIDIMQDNYELESNAL